MTGEPKICSSKICGRTLDERVGYVVRADGNYCLDCWVIEAIHLYPIHLRIVAGLQKHIDQQNKQLQAYERQAKALRLEEAP